MGRNELAVDAVEATNHSNPDTVAFVVTTGWPRATFRVDDEAFARWCAGRGGDDKLGSAVPDWAEYGAGATLVQLFLGARDNGVIGGDPNIELNVYGDDDEETSGFFVVLNNRAGMQRPLGLTSGWHELLHLDDISPRQRARAYLEEICTIGNFLLARLEVRTVSAAAEANTVSITRSDGTCAIWAVDAGLSDNLAVLIEESYGPPAAGH